MHKYDQIFQDYIIISLYQKIDIFGQLNKKKKKENNGLCSVQNQFFVYSYHQNKSIFLISQT